MENIFSNRIRSIYAYADETSSYGLEILIKFEGGSSLLFKKSQFTFSGNKHRLISPFSKWSKVAYNKLKENDVFISKVREDELTAYFIEFSNGDILYIYQWIIGNVDDWMQDYEIVSKDDTNYQETYRHMNEEFVEDAIISMED